MLKIIAFSLSLALLLYLSLYFSLFLSLFLSFFVLFLSTNLPKIFYYNRPISSDGIRFWHWECKSRLNICICCLPLATWIQADITHARDSFLLLSLSSSSFFSLLLLIFLFFYLSMCVFCSFHFFSTFMLSILLIIHLQPFNKIVRLMYNIYNVISLHKDLVLQGKISWTYLQNIFKLIVDTKCLDMYILCIWYICKRKEKETVCVCVSVQLAVLVIVAENMIDAPIHIANLNEYPKNMKSAIRSHWIGNGNKMGKKRK